MTILVAACAGSADSTTPTSATAIDADELCRLVPASAVAAAVGEAWPRVADPSGGCRYQSEVHSTSTVTIDATALTDAAWRAQVTKAGGHLTEQDGVLVADYRGDGFGPLDELWWIGPTGHTLVLHVDNGVTLEQALAVVDYAGRGTPAVSGGVATTVPPATQGTTSG